MVSGKSISQYPDYNPDYTEEDLEVLGKDRRYMAAAHAYALGLMSLGLGLSTGLGAVRGQRKLLSPFAFTRLFHEVARRIVDGRISVPPDIRHDHPEIYNPPKDAAVLGGYEGLPFSLNFHELNQPDMYARYLELRRWKPNEDDIQEMIKNEFFLASIDSWCKGLINGIEAMNLLFPDLKDLPRDLSASGYAWLQTEVAERILNGQLVLPPDLPQKYPAAYRQRGSGSSEQ